MSLSRNSPVCLVVGAAGFLGSHLVDHLLNKNIQVVGVDDLSTGEKSNLVNASKGKRFYFIQEIFDENFNLELPRLDYVFFMVNEPEITHKYLQSFKACLSYIIDYKPKVLLVSTLDCYDRDTSSHTAIKEAEKILASFTKEYKTNSRIARLAPVFGPRMHFREVDPVVKLIKSAITDDLQRETTALDFTTRSLYIDDAVALMVKSVLSGGTSGKIYDGALLHPIKVAEIKQVLLDPLWHENRGFKPTELPPWPTPNLVRTQKELAWKANTDIVAALKNTLAYFRQRPELIEKVKQRKNEEVDQNTKSINTATEDKKEEVGELKKSKSLDNLHKWQRIISEIKYHSAVLTGLVLIILALLIPGVSLLQDMLSVRHHLRAGNLAIISGDFKKAEEEVIRAKQGVRSIGDFFEALEIIKKTGLFQDQLSSFDRLTDVLVKTTEGAHHSVVGLHALDRAFKATSGERVEDASYLQASMELDRADKQLNLILADLSNPNLTKSMPELIKERVDDLQKKVVIYQRISNLGKSLSVVLPQLISSGQKSSYLILLQNNKQLHPLGGSIESLVQIDFDKGKVVDIRPLSPTDLDKKELKDITFEPDFPTSARAIQWYYQRGTGVRVAGIIALDYEAAVSLLDGVGAVELADENGSKKRIESFNLAGEINSSSKYASQILEGIVKNIFFLSHHNWPKIAEALNQALEKKHILIYVSDPTLFTYLSSEGWTGILPRQAHEVKGTKFGFLALSEMDITEPKESKKISRQISLESTLTNDLVLVHKLIIKYTAQSIFSKAQNAHKFRLKLYFPSGTKLIRAVWGNNDVTPLFKSFSDYGRAGYTSVLEIQPGQQKELQLNYEDVNGFSGNQIKIRQDVIKQPGTDEDEFEYRLNYPPSLKMLSGPAGGDGQVSFTTKLSKDLSFEVLLEAVKKGIL